MRSSSDWSSHLTVQKISKKLILIESGRHIRYLSHKRIDVAHIVDMEHLTRLSLETFANFISPDILDLMKADKVLRNT